MLEDATADAAEFDLVMRRTHGNLKMKHRHRIGRALLPMTPCKLALRQIGEDSNEDRAEFTEVGQAGDSRRCGALRFCWCLGDLLAIAIGHDPGRPADWMERLGRNEGATRSEERRVGKERRYWWVAHH